MSAPRGYYFVRFVPQDAVEATANEAVRLGYWPVEWELVSEDGDAYKGGATWMVWAAERGPDVCPMCGAEPAEDDA